MIHSSFLQFAKIIKILDVGNFSPIIFFYLTCDLLSVHYLQVTFCSFPFLIFKILAYKITKTKQRNQEQNAFNLL